MRRPEWWDLGCGLMLAALYAGQELMRAHFRLLSSEELQSYWNGVQPSLTGGIRSSFSEVLFPLRSGMWALVRMSTSMAGAEPLGIRLPALLAGGLTLLLLWHALRGRIGAPAATVGSLVLLATPACRWADFAGPRVLLLLCVGSGLACLIVSGGRRGTRPVEWLLGAALLLSPVLGNLLETGWIVPGVALAVATAFAVSRLPAVMQGVLLAVLGATVTGLAVADIRGVRADRHAYQSLLHLVESTTAPDEGVLVEDPLIRGPLLWYGSPALRQQFVLTADGAPSPHHSASGALPCAAPSRPDASREFVLVGRAKEGFAADCVSKGYRLVLLGATPEMERLSSGQSPMMRKDTQVMLAIPSPPAANLRTNR